MYFRESIRAIIKSKMFSLIISIQLIVAFFTLIAAINMIGGSLNQLIRFKSIFNENSTIIIHSAEKDNSSVEIDEANKQKIFRYYEELLRDKNISKMGIMNTNSIKYESIQDLECISDGEKSGFVNTIFADENFYRYIENIVLISGRNFLNEDFNKTEKDIVPVIISEDLMKYLALGDIFDGKYEVIGILKNNNKLFYNNNGNLYLGVTQKENTIIIPVNYKDEKNIDYVINNFMNNAIITLKDQSLTNQYIEKLNNDFANISLMNLKVTKVINEKNQFMELTRNGIVATVSISGLLIIYSFFGIMSIILTSLIRRKKEFGVKLSFGWTIRDICIQVIQEIFLIVISSYVISVLLSLILLKDEMYQLNIYIYGVLLLVVLLLTVIYSIIPISRIRKMNIVMLIKDVR